MWIIFAIGASVLWGLSYVLFEQVYKKISIMTALWIVCLIMFGAMLIGSILTGSLKPDLFAIQSSKNLQWLLLGGIATAILADVFIALSITNKNAPLAGLVEISYPIFIALFAYLLFRQNQINTAAIIGGILIFVGVFIIYFFNK